MTRSPLPFTPVAIAVQTVKLKHWSDTVKLVGIDLDSGRQVSIKIEFDAIDQTATTPVSDLVVVIRAEHVSL